MRRAVTFAVPVMVAALALAGCGTGSTGPSTAATPSPTATPTPKPNPFVGRSGRQILAAARDAADGARSVHMKGSGIDDGHRITIDLHVQYGRTAYGTIDVGNGGPMQIRRVGKTVYIRASAKFWRANGVPAQGALLIGGDWLRGSTRGPLMRDFMPLLSSSLIDDLLKADGKVSRAGRVTVGGTRTVGLHYRQEGSPGIVYVSTADDPFPLRVVSTDRKSPGKFTLSRWDEPVKVSAPRSAFNVDTLARRARITGCGCA